MYGPGATLTAELPVTNVWVRLGLPCSELLESIGLHLKIIFLASVEDNVATE